MSDVTESILSVPKGFSVAREGEQVLHITYRHTGMGCMILFLVVWLSGWTVACAAIVRELLGKPGQPQGYVFAIPFLAGEVFVAVILLWFFFGRTHFLLSPEGLVVTKQLFVWSKTRVFLMDEIKGFSQVKDGGEGDDSFPSWGLVVNVGKSVKILSRQEPKKSLWLGELLEQWSGKQFRRSTDAVEEF